MITGYDGSTARAAVTLHWSVQEHRNLKTCTKDMTSTMEWIIPHRVAGSWWCGFRRISGGCIKPPEMLDTQCASTRYLTGTKDNADIGGLAGTGGLMPFFILYYHV